MSSWSGRRLEGISRYSFERKAFRGAGQSSGDLKAIICHDNHGEGHIQDQLAHQTSPHPSVVLRGVHWQQNQLVLQFGVYPLPFRFWKFLRPFRYSSY